MGFLPEGQPVTPAEARYTVDLVTLMPMGDHPLATPAEKQAMHDLCHEYMATGFSYTLNTYLAISTMTTVSGSPLSG